MREISIWTHDSDFFDSWGDTEGIDEFGTIDAFNEAMEAALAATFPNAVVDYHSDMDTGSIDISDSQGDEAGVLAALSTIADRLHNALDSWAVRMADIF